MVCPGVDQPQRRVAWGSKKMGTFSVQWLFSVVISSSLLASSDGHLPSRDFHVSPFLKPGFLCFDFGFPCWILGKHWDLWLWKHSVFFYQRNKKQFSFYWDSCFHFSTYSEGKEFYFRKNFWLLIMPSFKNFFLMFKECQKKNCLNSNSPFRETLLKRHFLLTYFIKLTTKIHLYISRSKAQNLWQNFNHY